MQSFAAARDNPIFPSSPMGTQWRTLTLALLLAAATVVVYLPVHSHPFVNYDDEGYVTRNAPIQNGLSGQTVAWAFTTFHEANWHPLTWLSHALDCRLFGLNPAGHHDTNLVFHLINVLLLFFVLQRATGAGGPSFMVAAPFALHPLNVESVAWVAERKNLLSMMFFLLALGAYRWYVAGAANERSAGRRAGPYLLVVVCFALGLMSKPQIRRSSRCRSFCCCGIIGHSRGLPLAIRSSLFARKS